MIFKVHFSANPSLHPGKKWFRLALLAPVPGINPNNFLPLHSFQGTLFSDLTLCPKSLSLCSLFCLSLPSYSSSYPYSTFFREKRQIRVQVSFWEGRGLPRCAQSSSIYSKTQEKRNCPFSRSFILLYFKKAKYPPPSLNAQLLNSQQLI